MSWDSANQFVANMNAYNGTGYLGQTKWEMPPVDPNCSGWNCSSNVSPMGELFYNQFGLSRGISAVIVPNIAVGPFRNLQPYLYWSCLAATIQSACQTDGPVTNQEFSFSFGNGFEGTDILPNNLFATAYFAGAPASISGPVTFGVVNAASGSSVIAPNTYLEIGGLNLAPSGDSRMWQATDFIGNKLPTALDGVSVTVNGKSAYIYFISPTQIDLLTPPDSMSGPVQMVVTTGGTAAAAFTTQAQTTSPAFFQIGGGAYVAAQHANYTLIGPSTLYPGVSTPAKPGETVLIYANGFGPADTPVVSGAITQSGNLPTLPAVQIGGVTATVQFAGLVFPGEFQLNVVIPPTLPDGDQPITAMYGGQLTQTGALITIHN